MEYIYILHNPGKDYFHMGGGSIPKEQLEYKIRESMGSVFSLYIISGTYVTDLGSYIHNNIKNYYLENDSYKLSTYPTVLNLINNNSDKIPNFNMEYIFPEENSMEWVPFI